MKEHSILIKYIKSFSSLNQHCDIHMCLSIFKKFYQVSVVAHGPLVIFGILECTHFQDLTKVCIHCEKRNWSLSVSIFTTQTSMYSNATFRRKVANKRENILIISLFIMKFSLFYPIFQKIWSYEMPYFWVKRHLKPWKKPRLFSNLSSSEFDLRNVCGTPF